jgi:cytochrome c556
MVMAQKGRKSRNGKGKRKNSTIEEAMRRAQLATDKMVARAQQLKSIPEDKHQRKLTEYYIELERLSKEMSSKSTLLAQLYRDIQVYDFELWKAEVRRDTQKIVSLQKKREVASQKITMLASQVKKAKTDLEDFKEQQKKVHDKKNASIRQVKSESFRRCDNCIYLTGTMCSVHQTKVSRIQSCSRFFRIKVYSGGAVSPR